jgi:poly(3-hydroxybutyrate) depolymerase
VNVPADRKAHWLQPGVGHYGVFNGSRFRAEIVPRIADFVLSHNVSSKRTARNAHYRAPSSGAGRGGNGSRPATSEHRSLAPCD